MGLTNAHPVRTLPWKESGGFEDSSGLSWIRWCRKYHEACGEALRAWEVTDMKGIPPVEAHKQAVRGIPISDLHEAAGKGSKPPSGSRGLLGSIGRF